MSEKILYLECNSGISGDMTVAALLDLGADRQVLESSLASLPLTGYSIEIKDVFKSGIRACDFDVILEHDNQDHDMEYLHGVHEHSHEHHHEAHEHEHEHTHEHQHETSDHVHHHHDARNLNDIIEILSAGNLTDNARNLAIKIFKIIAQAEAAVHGKCIEEVHFHEVGAVDSIVDIAAVAVCIDNLKPDHIVVSPLTDGYGQIRCQHGIIPVPVPAVAAIAANEGLILKTSSAEGELVTPTGAAIAAALSSGEKLPEEYQILKTGFGAGKRDYATTGVLRAMLLKDAASSSLSFRMRDAESSEDDLSSGDTIMSLETNIDDSTGEALAYTLQQLFKAGVLDAFYYPIFMKKNRPAWLLRVLCKKEKRAAIEAVIFKHTTTIGIRCQEMQRTRMPRSIHAVETPWGMADVKYCTYGDETYYYPESDSVIRLAEKHGFGFQDMYNMIQTYARAHDYKHKA